MQCFEPDDIILRVRDLGVGNVVEFHRLPHRSARVKMASKHCYMHNAVTSRDMDGEKGHALECEVPPRYQYRKRDKPGHKGLLKAAGGPTNIEFGGFMPDEEAQALIKSVLLISHECTSKVVITFINSRLKTNIMSMVIFFAKNSTKRRPGSEHKVREMSGNNIFEGPYPLKEDCGGIGTDKTGRCPPRPFSSSKARDLQGHNIFEAFTCPYQLPRPPPIQPYEPEEMPLPPNKLRRNPAKLSSHFNFGGPVCIEPMVPPSQAAWAKQKMLYGSMDDLDKDPFPKPIVSNMKARELAGHVNLFGSTPRHSLPSTPVPERCDVVYGGVEGGLRKKFQQVHDIKMQALHGHDAVFLNSSPCCTENPKQKPPPLALSHRKAQELKGNDIFAYVKPDPRRCGHKPSNDMIMASIKADSRRCLKASKPSSKPSSRASSRQSSGGKCSSRASSKCSDYPSLKHM